MPHAHWGLRQRGLSLRATAPLTTVPAKASGTSNPLCKVLCTLQSLYFCSIGSMLVFCLVVDIPHTSNCSPKPLYSWMQTAKPQVATMHSDHKGQSPSVVSLSWVSSWHSGPRACCLLHNPQHLLKPTRAACKGSTQEGGQCWRDSLQAEPCVASSLAVTEAIAVACLSSTE
jgi:hypothetical protein